MPSTGAQLVILNQDRTETLLIKREDFRVWTVPGGRIEAGETPEAAAVREAGEETGYPVAIDNVLGEYWRPQLPNGGALIHAFVGHVTEGERGEASWEAIDVAWFAVDALPKRTLSFAREVIEDACFATGLPVKRTQYLPWWQARLIAIGLQLRGLRNWWRDK